MATTKTEAVAEQATKDLRSQYALAKMTLMKRINSMCSKGNPGAMLTLVQAVSTLVAIERADA